MMFYGRQSDGNLPFGLVADSLNSIFHQIAHCAVEVGFVAVEGIVRCTVVDEFELDVFDIVIKVDHVAD